MRTLEGAAGTALVLVLTGVLSSPRAGEPASRAELGTDLAPSASVSLDVGTDKGAPNPDRVVLAILIGMTDDPLGGRAAQRDLTGMQQLLEEEIPKERLRIVLVKGQDCNARTIIAKVREVGRAARPGDSIFCYYSGRGAYHDRFAKGDPSGGHYFPLEGGDLPRKTLFDKLVAQPGRLKVLVTADTGNVTAKVGHLTAQVVTRIQKGPTALEQLLLHHRGHVDLRATPRDQRGWCSDELGSWFTVSFRRTATDARVYAVTDRSLDSLREAGVPEAVLARLSRLKGERFGESGAFAVKVKQILTRYEGERHLSTILNHATDNPDWGEFVKQLSREADTLFRDTRRAILSGMTCQSRDTLKAIRTQTDMKPAVGMCVVRDEKIPAGGARVMRRTFYVVVYTRQEPCPGG